MKWHGTAPAMGLVSSIAGLIVFSIYQRREQTRSELLARQALSEAAETLEQRIASRTIDLVGANTELRRRYGQLKRAELMLRQTQNELIQAGKLGMLGQMAAGMTHELSQPLAAVQAFADNAVAFIDLADSASARNNLEHINDACVRMSHIIRQLKGFARKSDDQVGAVDLAQAISNAALLVRSDYTQHGVTLHIQINKAAQVMGDMVRVEQVIINLLRNALDALKTCEEKKVHVELNAVAQWAQIRIMDSGPGLAPQVRERLFEPFFTTKPAGQGLGLGLAISSSIVQAMEGELLASNGILGGATFILKLPIWNSSGKEKT
jgi:two-component system, NtrC family, C4-dicarboxylate transport sensor histidine kinase DctB